MVMMLEVWVILVFNAAMDGVEVFMDMKVIEVLVVSDVGLGLMLLEELMMNEVEVD